MRYYLCVKKKNEKIFKLYIRIWWLFLFPHFSAHFSILFLLVNKIFSLFCSKQYWFNYYSIVLTCCTFKQVYLVLRITCCSTITISFMLLMKYLLTILNNFLAILFFLYLNKVLTWKTNSYCELFCFSYVFSFFIAKNNDKVSSEII